MTTIFEGLQSRQESLSSDSDQLSQVKFATNDFLYPRFATTVDDKYRKNDLIIRCFQLVPKFLLSERSINVLKECDKAGDGRNEIVQHMIGRMQKIEITIDQQKRTNYSHDGASTKLSDGSYLLEINQELFDDYINSSAQSSISNKAKLRLLVTVCHEFIPHKMHMYLLNDQRGKSRDERTPPDLGESGFYWEDAVIGGRVVKSDGKHSFLPKNQPKINLDDELCSLLLNIESYGNVHQTAYSMKEINDEKSSDSVFSGKKRRGRIQTLSVNLSGAQKRKKMKCDRYTRYRLTPNQPIFAEVTLVNEGPDVIEYPDLPQNCGSLQCYLYRFNEDHGEMFSIDLPNNTNNWACSYRQERHRLIPPVIPENVFIKPNESKTFVIKVMEIDTTQTALNQFAGHYYLEAVIGYYIQQTDTHYLGETKIEFDVECDDGENDDENLDSTEDGRPILK